MEHEPNAPEQGAALEVVYTASGEMEAQAIRSVLEGAGIPAHLKMEAAQQLFAVTVDGLGAVKVMVPADRMEEARSVIENPALPIDDQGTSDGQ